MRKILHVCAQLAIWFLVLSLMQFSTHLLNSMHAKCHLNCSGSWSLFTESWMFCCRVGIRAPGQGLLVNIGVNETCRFASATFQSCSHSLCSKWIWIFTESMTWVCKSYTSNGVIPYYLEQWSSDLLTRRPPKETILVLTLHFEIQRRQGPADTLVYLTLFLWFWNSCGHCGKMWTLERIWMRLKVFATYKLVLSWHGFIRVATIKSFRLK